MPASPRSRTAGVLALAAIVVFAGAVFVVLKARDRTPGAVQVYLRPGASEDDVLRVYTTVLGNAQPNGKGFTLHAGIAGVSLAGDETQTILVVLFRDGLSRRDRDRLIAELRTSPLVSRVEAAAR